MRDKPWMARCPRSAACSTTPPARHRRYCPAAPLEATAPLTTSPPLRSGDLLSARGGSHPGALRPTAWTARGAAGGRTPGIRDRQGPACAVLISLAEPDLAQ